MSGTRSLVVAGISGNSGSRPMVVALTGVPRTSRTRSTTTRPCAGKAGHTRALHTPAADIRASTSAPIRPRRVESIFLNRCVAGARATAERTRRADSPPASARDSVSMTRTSPGEGARGQIARGTEDRPANRVPVSQAPVRSSATIVSIAVTGQAALRPGRHPRPLPSLRGARRSARASRASR